MTGPLEVVAVGLAAAAGAAARYLLDVAVQSRTRGVFPWGTLTVNLSGSLLLGVLVGAGAGAPVLTAGFCGAFTTFSTWTYETVRLVEDGSYLEAFGNVGVSLVAGLVAAVAGLALGAAVG